MPRHALLLSLVLAGCAPRLEPAPEALDQNLRWSWLHAEDASDDELLSALAALRVAAKADSRTQPLKGQLPLRLAREDVAQLGLPDGEDPAHARGLLLLDPLACPLQGLAPLLAAADQAALHPGLFDAYTRASSPGAAAWGEGTEARASWDAHMEAHLPVNDRYSAELHGELRRVDGRLLLQRTWLKGPAAFQAGSQSRFPQDYIIELFFETAPGKAFHAMAAWRELHVGGLGLSTEDDAVFAPMLDRLVELDRDLEKGCP